MATAAKKFMVIKVTMEDTENLQIRVPQTKANIAKLSEIGEVRTLKVRNPFGRKGAPKPVKRSRKTTATA